MNLDEIWGRRVDQIEAGNEKEPKRETSGTGGGGIGDPKVTESLTQSQ
jgi:hypothetical protein